MGRSAPSKREQAGGSECTMQEVASRSEGVHLARRSKQVGGSAPSKREQAGGKECT